MASILHLDFETRSAADIKKCGADFYARHPSTDIQCLGFQFDDGPVQLIKRGEPLPFEVVDHVISGGTIVAHNASFEHLIWNHVCTRKYGWPEIYTKQLCCTMCMCYAMGLPGSLDKASASVGLENGKDQKGYRVMLQLSQPRDIKPDGTIVWWEESEHPEKFEMLYNYCRQDVRVEHELYKRLMRLPPKETEIWELDQKINQRGIQIDLKAVKTAMAIVEMEQKRLNLEMQKVTDNAVGMCTAVSQLTDWIKWQGIELDGVAKSDVTELLSRKDLPAQIRKALLLRQEAAKSSTAKLNSMLEGADENGRIRGIFQYHGAGTGRWAGRRIQPQNFPRSVLSQEEIEEVFELFGGVE